MQTAYLVKVLAISDVDSQATNGPIPKTQKVTNNPEGVSQSEKKYFPWLLLQFLPPSLLLELLLCLPLMMGCQL